MATSYEYTVGPAKEVKRQKNWSTGKIEWDMYLDGRYIGTKSSKIEAETELDQVVYGTLTNACAGWGCVDTCGDCVQGAN